MGVTFRRGIREQVGLVIGIAGPSGGGKTLSAMALSAGIARALGDKPFAVIDTENRRALHYAEDYRFDHCNLAPPFTPEAYSESIRAADDAGYPVIVVDTASHGHAGEGGLLDMHEAELDRMAGTDWKKREAVKMAAWVKPKTSQKRFVQQMLRARAHIILTFRAEQKVDIIRDKDGKMQVVPKKIMSGFSDWIPIAEKNLLYELTASFLLTPDAPGVPKPIKPQNQHRPFFPLDTPITEKVGELLAAWAAGGAKKGAAHAGAVQGVRGADAADGQRPEGAADVRVPDASRAGGGDAEAVSPPDEATMRAATLADIEIERAKIKPSAAGFAKVVAYFCLVDDPAQVTDVAALDDLLAFLRDLAAGAGEARRTLDEKILKRKPAAVAP